jgi:ribokinase
MPNTDERAQAAANVLHARGAAHVIIKRGAQGAYWSHAGSTLSIPAVPVVVVDTVAAGDCYNGALACALARGEPMPSAMRYAAAAAAIAVTRRGAQRSMPTAAEVDALLR